MIDITSVQAFKIPPEIEELQTEKAFLIEENNFLTKQTKLIIGMVAISFTVIAITMWLSKREKNEDQKK